MQSLLLPAPSRLTPLAGSVPVPHGDTPEQLRKMLVAPAVVDPSLASWLSVSMTGAYCGSTAIRLQSYRLRIDPSSQPPIRVESPTIAGARYAIATLGQLVRCHGRTIPAMEIDDEPAIAARGVMLDVSRCRVPTMEDFRRIIDQLCELRCNHLQLYTEHTFAYEGHEEVWRDWSPITPGEAIELDSYCRARGIDLAPNQNCFGHLRQWLDLPRYASLAETHGDWMFDVWPRSGPFSLCPTDPASLRFVEGLLDQLLPCFRSGLVNIGCDETYDIAYGRSKGEVARRGRGAVFAEFVGKVDGLVRRHGKRSMFWADIALSQPECLASLPDSMAALAWGYEPDTPWERWCEVLRGREFWLCPGTSSWRSITGRTSERRANVRGAVESARRHGAAGLLACDWGDSGHWQTWPISLHAVADALACAWEGPRRADDDRHAGTSLHLWGDPSGETSRWLDEFGDADLSLRDVCLGLSRPGMQGRLRNQSAIFADLFKRRAECEDVGPVPLWERTLANLRGLGARLGPLTRGLPPLARDQFLHSHAMACFSARRGLARRSPNPPWAQMREEMAAIEAEHARLWRATSREGGLAQSLAYFGQIDLAGEATPG